MEFKIKIEKKWIGPIEFIINYRHLNIKIIKKEPIPGPMTSEDPDTEVTLRLLSGNPGEIFFLGFYAGQERLSITLQ